MLGDGWSYGVKTLDEAIEQVGYQDYQAASPTVLGKCELRHAVHIKVESMATWDT